ncbi:MAG TPA: hypothetical protein VHZ81_06985 [Galbitalea sp.]|nr:hypothetical protein [Galbitalea sp.]
MHRFRLAAIASLLAVAIGLTLAGCTSGSSTPKATPTAKSSVSTALSGLAPAYPAKLTAASAKSVTVKTADAIQALIAATDIATVDDDSKLIAATKSADAYYGVARAVATNKGFDPITQAEAMEKLLVLGGWTERDTKTTTARYSVVLTRDTAAGTSVLGLQAVAESKNTPAVVLITVESPDIPAT